MRKSKTKKLSKYLLVFYSGSLLTDAQWMRQFVLTHRDYKQNSIVSDEIQYDLLWKTAQIANGKEQCSFLFESNMKTRTHLCVD